jgi:hypothetical protein
MPYLGNPPAEAYTTTVKDSFSGDGSTTAFTLSVPSTTNDLRVVVENVIQDPTVAYSVSGTTLTFTSAPPTGTNNIYAVNLGPAVQTVTPPAEIGNATTFNSSVTVQGAFTSVGIDDNADATAITIDSSERVLIGHTTANGYALDVAKANLGVAGFNRTGTNGEIAAFMKDGAQVGSIGTPYTGELQIHATGANSSGLLFTSGNTIQPMKNSAADDGNIDIGTSGNRFNNLYLNGGVYVGGTGSANYLDDYEEGTFTPTLGANSSDPTVGYDAQYGFYTKIGRLVTVTIYLDTNSRSGGSGYMMIKGLPFSINNSYLYYGAVQHEYKGVAMPSNANNLFTRTNKGSSALTIEFLDTRAGVTAALPSSVQIGDVQSDFRLIGTISYMTD